MSTGVTHILPLTKIRRERLLPVPGKVLVRKGQKVNANDVIAEASLTSEHVLLDIARGLSLPVEKADALIRCKAGDIVAEKDIIAGPVGLARRVMRSPAKGKVVLAGSGQVLLEMQGKPYELKAGLSGEVVDLIDERGAIIEASGTLIQGVWGNGLIDFGLLTNLAKTPDQRLIADQLDVSMRGAIVLAGYVENEEVIKAADDIPLRGLILASVDPLIIPAMNQAAIPIILIEGFGKRAMNTSAYKLLSSNERREVAINASPWDRYQGTRPELIIPLPATQNLQLPREVDNYAIGQSVHITRAPYASKIGTIVELRGPTSFQSGLRAPSVLVRLENGENALLPLANLEVLG